MKGRNSGRLVLLIAVALAGFVVALGACSSSTDPPTTAGPGGSTTTGAASDLAPDQTLRLNLATEPPSLDPNLATDTTSGRVINNIFEGLVHLNVDGSTFPGAAETWEVSADGLTYTFYLRGTDTWTNGDPVTSEDFKNSWLRILDPKTAAGYAYQLYFIKGAEDFTGGKGTADQVAIDATDPKVLKVTLKAPTPWFVPLMAHNAYFPIPKKVVDQFGDKWTEPANIVTNGPYKLTSWNHSADLTLEKWDGWREAQSVTLKTIQMPMINESTTGVAAFENGELDVQADLPVADMDRLKTLPEYHVFPLLGVFYLGFNVEAKPLDNVDVRRALSLAIDRQSIVDNVTKAGEVPATGFIPQGMPGFDVITKDYIKPTAQVEEAKALLAKAGFSGGTGLPEIVIYYPTSEGSRALSEVIQAQWKAIGVNATLKNMEWKQFNAFVPSDPSVMAFLVGWVADFSDAYNFFDVLRGGGGNNYTRWKNATYDADLASSLNAASEADRYKIYSEMEGILSVQDMPVAPLYWASNPDLVKSYVAGYEPNPLGETVNLWTVKLLKH
jgi:oligopeptide transport system substrate-binding protein